VAKGHRLGSREEREEQQGIQGGKGGGNGNNFSTFSVTYTEEGSMGVTVDADPISHRPVIMTITPNSPSYRLGVQEGDVVISVDGNSIANFDDFMAVIPVLGRPVTLTYARRNQQPNSRTASEKIPSSSTSSSSSASSTSSSSSFSMMSTMSSVFGRSSSAPTTAPQSTAPPLSEQEKEQRREAMRQAAAQRAGAWDKKVASGRKERSGAANQIDPLAPANNKSPVEVNPETARLINEAKRREAAQVQAMGYDPFKPHMSFSGGKGGVITSSAPSSSSSSSSTSYSSSTSPTSSPRTATASNESAPQTEEPILEDDEELAASVDLCLSTLITSASSTSPDDPLACDEAAVQTALVTANKMLTSLLANQSEPKFRSIRVQNGAFQNKVASVPGAVDLMIAAGFQEVLEKGEDEGASGEVFLKHDASAESLRKLQYVVARLKELVS